MGNDTDSQDNTNTPKKVSSIENDHENVRNLPNTVGISLAFQNEGIYRRDVSMTHGEACNSNNIMKDVMEIEWLHSPSQTKATSSMPHYHHPLAQK